MNDSDDGKQLSIEECNELLARQPASWRGLKTKGDILASDNDLLGARKCFTALAMAYPDQGYGFRRRIEIDIQLKRWDDAVESCKLAEHLFSERPFWQQALTIALQKSGRLPDAASCLAHLALFPNDSNVRVLLARHRISEGCSELAIDELAESANDDVSLSGLANIAIRLRRWPEAHEALCQLGAEKHAARLATVLIQLGRLDEAEVLATNASGPWGIRSLSWIAKLRHDWVALHELTTERIANGEQSIELFDQHVQAATWSGATDDPTTAASDLPIAARRLCRNLISALRHELHSEWQEAKDEWASIVKTERTATNLYRLGLCEAFCRDEEAAVATFSAIDSEFSDSDLGGLGRARMQSHYQRYGPAVDAWRETLTASPSSNQAARGLLNSLLWAGQFAEADSMISEMESVCVVGSLDYGFAALARADWLRLQYLYKESLTVLEALLGQSMDRETVGKATSMRCQILTADVSDPEDLRRCAADLLQLEVRRPAELLAATAALVAAGDEAQAMAIVKRIPDSQRTIDKAPILRSWRFVRDGQIEAARHEIDEWIGRSFLTAFHAPIGELEPATPVPSFASNDVILFCCVRDEVVRLPAFLAHYRRLGVRNMVIVDNMSTDGTWELLNKEDGVFPFRTSDHFITASSGMRWINHLIDEYASENWCLFVDADEFLVFDGPGTTIAQVTALLEDRGYDALGSFMLDAHPADLKNASYRAGDPPLQHSAYHTGPYRAARSLVSPYREVRGGFRETTLGMKSREMTKLPIVNAKTGVRWLTNHSTTPSTCTYEPHSALLHFKWLVDPVERSAKETSWADFSFYSANRSRALQAFAQNEKGLTLLTEASSRIEIGTSIPRPSYFEDGSGK